jgi:large subunit ribosomal protein L18e
MKKHKIRIKNPMKIRLYKILKEAGKKSNFWKRIAEEALRPRRRKRVVNISKINRLTKPKDKVIVPGKVLGDGEINHSITLSAFEFSRKAIEKILSANGKILNIEEMIKKNPTGKGVKIIV